jgi:hypothetical protein
MRMGRLWAIALLVLVAVPGAARAAGGPPLWPTAADVRGYTPGLGAKDATCVANYYRGRLSRRAWLTPYFKLTPAEKRVTDAGFDHCQTKAQRIALVERQEAIYFGRHPANACVARAMDARTPAQRRALTSLQQQIRADDAIFRRCGLIGQLYATLGAATKLMLTKAEQQCTNRVGSADPVRLRGRAPSTAERRAVGTVFDRCVGGVTERAMWRGLLASFKPARAIPCIVEHSLRITFVTFFSDAPGLQRQTKAAVAACRPTVTS